jgi:hypothetical protein
MLMLVALLQQIAEQRVPYGDKVLLIGVLERIELAGLLLSVQRSIAVQRPITVQPPAASLTYMIGWHPTGIGSDSSPHLE